MFDYIVVGGGSAGSVLAGRLTEDPSVRVCLLEAGPADKSVLIHCPAGLAVMAKFELNGWGFNTTPQAALSNRRGYQPRGKVLGGSSSINAMVYIRGQHADYDHWAAQGNPGWGWEDVKPYFLRAEHNERGADAWHAQGGPFNVADLRAPNRFSQYFADAGVQAGHPYNADFNGATQEGVGPYQVTRCMSSTVSACLATNFKVKGINYSITSACSTSAHCIGAAAQQIAWGVQDVMFAGGGEELSWGMSLLFDGMGAMSSKYNETPEKASRAYDANRDGFVIAGGGGAVVLESLEHAQARGANILAEVVGFGATSDGEDMVAPSGDGAIACMQQAMEGLGAPIDYINTHGTSTPVGDMQEVRAMRALFGDKVPPFSSTKSLTGHSQGATGVQEAIYCLYMLQGGFIAGSANIENLDPAAEGMPIVRVSRDAPLTTVLSNSFGFGGTNASLVLRRWDGA